MVLLYSGVRTDYSGRYSYLAHRLAERVEGADASALAARLSSDQAMIDNTWFGYLGYGLKNSLEPLAEDTPNWLSLPDLCFMRFHTVYRFDHDEHTLSVFSDRQETLPAAAASSSALPPVMHIESPMRRDTYLAHAAHIIERIHAGDLYQANLTRKYTGTFAAPPDDFALFKKLCAASPAPYSAFLRLGDVSVLSSSPELFLTVDSSGHMRTRPIKGTAPRHPDPAQDAHAKQALSQSGKDRAENLMITDLMRNDLSRACLPGSVQVQSLFDVTTHATIHHMSSTVTGQKRTGCSTLEALLHCFPPGSMTGAPKIMAMNLCSHLEKLERGPYSGAIGWLGGDGSCELSVVIRTLLLKGTQFEFQVGGGIVADSTPTGELQELIDKSKGIIDSLGIDAAEFARI